MKNRISMPLKSIPGSDAGRIRNKGFTLVELLVAMAVSSIVMVAIYSVYAGLTRSYTTQNASADVQQAARASVDIMAEDIMMAGLRDRWQDYSGNPPAISSAGSWEMIFTSDRNMDGAINGNSENITYQLVGRQLQITDAIGTEVLIDNVINNNLGVPLFTYFSESPDDLANDKDLFHTDYGYTNPMVDASELEDIRTVEISVWVEEPAGREGMVQRNYTTRVRCRN